MEPVGRLLPGLIFAECSPKFMPSELMLLDQFCGLLTGYLFPWERLHWKANKWYPMVLAEQS